MKRALRFCSFSALLAASTAHAETYYVSPTGTATEGCTRGTPCDLGSGAALAMAGDTVILMDGVYNTSLYIQNTGTPDAWITFQADQCATPILEGSGAGPMDDVQDGGVASSVGEYLRFEGIVARGWNIGFGNGWADGVDSDAVSNGHWEIDHCISYSNGRTGFTFFSAPDFTIQHSISAHNGSSQVHSWSSGITLFEATGTLLVEGNVSFENSDGERHTDGSGFIVDEGSNNAQFIDNLAFGNGGSCLRLTKSSGTVFVNNTCYHNAQFGSLATGPDNPSELYFTNSGVTVQGVNFMNNVLVATGQAPAAQQAVVNQPTSGWTNNAVATGEVNYFLDPTAANPSFLPAMGDTTLTGKSQGGANVPTEDIGFDPKCIVKRTPEMVGQVARESWWQYDIDIEYIQSIGGVAACFNPAARSGSSDIGAYQSGGVTTIEPGSCVPPPESEPDPVGGAAGATGAGGPGAGGTSSVGTTMGGASTGGAAVVAPAGGDTPVATPAAAGGTNAPATPVTPAVPGGAAVPTDGAGVATPPPSGVAPGAVPGVSPSAGPAASAGPVATTPPGPGAAPSASSASAPSAVGSSDATNAGGCGCRVPAAPSPSGRLSASWLLLLGSLFFRRFGSRRGSSAAASRARR